MKTSIRTGVWDVMRHDAMFIRQAVFVVEQGVPAEIEIDEFDPVSLHAVAYDDQAGVIGTGRLLPDGHIGRMAVAASHRNKGIGSALLRLLVDAAWARGDLTVVLHAQTHAAAFYQRMGFQAEGDTFMEAGIPHIQMVLHKPQQA
jgi:predicted GNAT family N-acyltransferase